MRAIKNRIISTLIASIVFGHLMNLNAYQEVKWSEEAKVFLQGICASQYLNGKKLKWSLKKLESEDVDGSAKVSHCAASFEKRYDPQMFFQIFKLDTDRIKTEAKIYLK